jgi:hypothetical protein
MGFRLDVVGRNGVKFSQMPDFFCKQQVYRKPIFASCFACDKAIPAHGKK